MSKQVERKIAIIEDDVGFARVLSQLLSDIEGVHVVAVAANFLEAEALVSELETKGIDTVFLDGNLSPDQTGGHEGEILAQQIRDKAANVTIIGMSQGPQPYADAHVPKKGFFDRDLSSILQQTQEVQL